jgi:hypothetical protein
MHIRSQNLVSTLALGLLMAALVFLPSADVQAQDTLWIRQFGSMGHCVPAALAADGAGNVYVGGWTSAALAGQTFNGGSRDAFVRKYSPNGSEAWTRQFGTPREDVVMDMAADNQGNLYVAGQTGGTLPGQTQAGPLDAFVRKYDSRGAEVWTRQFGTATNGPAATAAASSTIVDDAGNLYVAGWVTGALAGQSSAGHDDAFVRKYDAVGVELWTRQFGTPDHDVASDLAVDSAGSVYVGGQAAETGGDAGYTFVRKFTPGGAEVWRREIGRSTTGLATHLTVDLAGNLYVVGEITDNHPHTTQQADENHHGHPFVRKYDPTGASLWTRQWGTPGADVPVQLAVDPAGSVYVTGRTTSSSVAPSPSAQADTFVRKYDSAGNLLWTRTFGSSEFSVATRVVVEVLGSVYVAGWTSGTFAGQRAAGASDAFLAKVLP